MRYLKAVRLISLKTLIFFSFVIDFSQLVIQQIKTDPQVYKFRFFYYQNVSVS